MSSTLDTSSMQWCNTSSSYKSESTEQLDKLLAGLDRLSETLPDLGAGAGGDRRGKVPGGWQAAKSSAPAGSVNNSVVSRAETVRGGMRSYEDDLDYALEKDDNLVIKGPERKVLLGTDNYADHYSDNYKTPSNMDTQHQPYHTRNDSKPFSYIR